MNTRIVICAAVVMALNSVAAYAAVTDEEAKKLGSTLTPFGAEKAGNKDGSIPAYTGGLTKLPADFKAGSKKRPDPYADEKPLFSIDAKNMNQYSEYLTDGVKALMKKFPTYRIDVYPSHRTVSYPQYVLDNSVKNATHCKTTNNGLAIENCHGGLPFPIPKDGYEAMWNHLLRFQGYNYDVYQTHWYVDAAGKIAYVSKEYLENEYPYYDPAATSTTGAYWFMRSTAEAPARIAGERNLLIDYLEFDKPRRVFQYLPGQRRTRAAPDLAYDTPIPNRGGANTMDDLDLYSGKMDRFDFKLVGKKEIFIPYNSYKLTYGLGECDKPEKVFTPNHTNPSCVRWEKQRVWVIEATLKPGKRHIYQKRVFYLDEDSWGSAGISDQYDATGAMYRVGFLFTAPRYDAKAATSWTMQDYDFSSNVYAFFSWLGAEDGGIVDVKSRANKTWSPESLSGTGIR